MSVAKDNPVSQTPHLTAGVARVDITPPIGQRMHGIVRRIEPSEGIESPLTATALVLDDGLVKVAVLDCDLIGFDVDRSDELRRRIGSSIGVPAAHVLLGTTHTHSGPGTFLTASGLGITNWGSEFDLDATLAENYLCNLGEKLIGVAGAANRSRVPVRAGCGCGHVEVAVNREERLESGRTVLGQNPNGPHDYRTEVLRLDRLDGSTLAILTGYAAHPVVMGWSAKLLSPDFPGVTRRVVEQLTGGTCLYMTGAAGNQATVEFLQDDWTEMTRIGMQVGCAIAQAAAAIDTRPHHVVREFDASLSKLAVYHKVFEDNVPSPRLTVASRRVSVPYSRLPTVDELKAKQSAYEKEVRALQSSNAPKGRIYAELLGQHWAESELKKVDAGTRADSLSFDIVGFRLGDFAIMGMPGEPFVEIGLAVKSRSRARQTLFAGYSTGAIAYWPDPSTVREATAMSVTSAVCTHGISAPPCEQNHRIICDAFDGMLTELGI